MSCAFLKKCVSNIGRFPVQLYKQLIQLYKKCTHLVTNLTTSENQRRLRFKVSHLNGCKDELLVLRFRHFFIQIQIENIFMLVHPEHRLTHCKPSRGPPSRRVRTGQRCGRTTRPRRVQRVWSRPQTYPVEQWPPQWERGSAWRRSPCTCTPPLCAE